MFILSLKKINSISLIYSNEERDLLYKKYLISIKNIDENSIQKAEKVFREYIFIKNVEKIKRINEDENRSWTAGLNFFTDLSEKELKNYLGFGKEKTTDLYQYVLKNKNEDPGAYKDFMVEEVKNKLRELKNAKELKKLRGINLSRSRRRRWSPWDRWDQWKKKQQSK